MVDEIVQAVPEVTPPPQQRKKVLGQNSEKVGTVAEDVALPKNQRSIQRSADVELQDVEAEATFKPSATTPNTMQTQPKVFPIFMIAISFVQVGLMYCVDKLTLFLIFGYDPHRRHEIWRYVTIMLSHTGFTHLWLNVILQLILGCLLEIVHHWKPVAIIYISSVLGSTVIISVVNPHGYGSGASAGLYGLLSSNLSTIILNWNVMNKKCCRLFSLLFCLALEMTISSYLDFVDRETETSHIGHIAGALTGLMVSILVLKNFVKHPWEKKLQKICVGILTILCTIIFIINVTAWGLYLPEEWNFNYRSSYDHYFSRTIIESQKLCMEDKDCKLTWDQYNFNGTI